MNTKRDLSDGDELRPPKRTKGEWSKAEDISNPAHQSVLERLDELAVDKSRIYPESLEEGTTRILVLGPGSATDDIKCSLRQRVSLSCSDKVLSYDALSYVWGETDNPVSITLCGSPFEITRNLAEALRHLRFPTSDRLLWVDAICINQGDAKEKEVQIRSMHYIYKLAKSVIGWLGLSNDDSKFAYETMKSMEEPLRHGAILSAVMVCGLSNGKVQNEQDSVYNLMERQYWSRAWIVQEMIFARSFLIQCGFDVVPYSTLRSIYPRNMLSSMNISSEENFTGHTYFRGDSELRLLELDFETMNLKRFLDCFLDRQCRLRHDNIFAFLNLLSEDIRQQIPISYEIPIPQLLCDTARVFIKSTQSLYIIVIRGRQRPSDAQGSDKWQRNMPSWCPYLGTPYECCSLEPHSMPSLFAERAVVSFVRGKKGEDRLRVKGDVIGKVSQTISRGEQPRIGVTSSWDQADVDRERKHFMKCLYLGLKGMPKDEHSVSISIKATTQTLLAGQIENVLSAQEDGVRGVQGLRNIWLKGNSRLVCSFRLGRAAKRALYSSKSAPAGWINRIALVPRTVRLGDVICMILGCPAPVVLRRNGKRYHVLGEAYLDTSAMGQFTVTVGLRDFVLE